MQFAGIIVLSVLMAIAYGIVHDQVTVRVCLEYFTVFHPPVFHTESPTLLAVGWGVIATWWVGLPLGVILAVASRLGPRSKWTVKRLVRPLLMLLGVTGGCALLAGIAGFVATQAGWASPPSRMIPRIPEARHAAFVADLWVHRTSYAAGSLGGFVLSLYVACARLRAGARKGRSLQ